MAKRKKSYGRRRSSGGKKLSPLKIIGSRVTFTTPTGVIRGVVRSAPYQLNRKVVVDVKPMAEIDIRFSPNFKRVSRRGGTMAVSLLSLRQY